MKKAAVLGDAGPSEDYARVFLKNCPEMIMLLDSRLRLLAFSSACEPLLAQDAYMKTPDEAFAPGMPAEWICELESRAAEAMRTLARCRYDSFIELPGRWPIYAQISVSPALDGGQCHGVTVTVGDMTEMMEVKRRAEQAAQSKSLFLANMSHEIRTPMNAVKGLSELLALTELSPLQRNYVNNIINSANSLLGIINDVLDFSKIDANKIELINGPYGLAALIADVCNVVSVRADEKELRLVVDADPDLPSVLTGDEVRIKQIITNLMSNAVKYTHEGFVRLRVGSETRDGRLWLRCDIEDSGVGIKQEDLPLLFEAFSRADLLSNRHIAGTGLGLAITRRLVYAMDGTVDVSSVYGEGSVFSFAIPQGVVDETPIAAVREAGAKRVLLPGEGAHTVRLAQMLSALGVGFDRAPDGVPDSGELSRYTHCILPEDIPERVARRAYTQMPACLFGALKNIRHAMTVSDYQDAVIYLPLFIADVAQFLNREAGARAQAPGAEDCDELRVSDANVLVVDDNEINLVVSGDMLQAFGADVTCAESGARAIELCAQTCYDIIFMDHMMPGKDGIETTQEIRAGGGPNAQSPIVALTANVVNDMKSVYLRSGMDDFIAKPIDLNDISRVLLAWLPGEKIGKGSAAAPQSAHPRPELLTPEGLIEAFDKFGLYSSDVMREMGGDFAGYIARMEAAGEVLGGMVDSLKRDVKNARWDEFADRISELSALLYGIGARDCSSRARKLSAAGREANVRYIQEDFGSLMGNMYMLDKKLEVIVPFARAGAQTELPLGSAQYLHGCLEKLGRALETRDGEQAVLHINTAAAYSLDMDVDMALKAVQADLARGDYDSALAHHNEFFRAYTGRIARGEAR